jgi:anti-anti-sigma factor
MVAVVGALDIALGPELDAELAAHVARGRSIVRNSRAVPLMNSTGIRVLIEALNRARARSLRFELLGSDAVDRTLEVAHLGHHFSGQSASVEART